MSRSRSQKQARRAEAPPAPSRKWLLGSLLLCAVGLALSADLTRLHVAAHLEPDYDSYCSVSEELDCTAVARSSYSVVLGLPLAVWGLIAYTALGLLGIGALRGGGRTVWPLGLAFVGSLGMALAGIGLYVLSHTVIHSVCLVCVATYLVNVGLAITSYLAFPARPGSRRDGLARAMGQMAQRPSSPILFAVAVAGVALLLWSTVPRYWIVPEPVEHTGPGGLPAGVTAEGHAWIGAEAPVMEIVEFSDYECPHCRAGHARIREMVTQYPGLIRLVHQHYPLDSACNPNIPRPFHVNACRYARMAHCALEQGKFWEANDWLYAHHTPERSVSIEDLAEGIGLDLDHLRSCTDSAEARGAVDTDLAAGREVGVLGTPTFVIGDKVYSGGIPPEVFEPFLGESPVEPADEAGTSPAGRP